MAAPASPAARATLASPAGRATLATAATPLRDRVRTGLPSVAALLDQLLDGAVVVDGGWEAAVDVAVAHPDLLVVTRAGDRCAQGLWQVGAGGTGVTGAALEEARRKVAATMARAAAADRALQDARRAAEAARVATNLARAAYSSGVYCAS